jgi:hypothetical protein
VHFCTPTSLKTTRFCITRPVQTFQGTEQPASPRQRQGECGALLPSGWHSGGTERHVGSTGKSPSLLLSRTPENLLSRLNGYDVAVRKKLVTRDTSVLGPRELKFLQKKISRYVFLHVTPSSLADKCQRFKETHCLHLQGRSAFCPAD